MPNTTDSIIADETIICAHCGEPVTSTRTVHNAETGADEEWCDDCIADYAYECDHCGRLTTSVNTVDTPYGDEDWCDSCIESDAYVCDRCGRYTSTTTSVAVRYNWRTGDVYEDWCGNCLEEHAVACDDCGEYFADDNYDGCDSYDMWNGYSRTICHSCREHYYWCNDCENLVHDDDVVFVGGNAYCPDCAPETSDNLEGYSHTRGIAYWLDDGNCVNLDQLSEDDLKRLFLGVELETDYNDSAARLADDVMDEFTHNHVVCKKDGSLTDNGVEIVAQPMTPYHILHCGMWERISEIVLDHGGKSHDACTCGLHIHISRKFFRSHEAVYMLDRMFTRFEKQLVKFSRRRNLGWCHIKAFANTEDVFDRKATWAEEKKCIGRYQAVNDTNINTVEIRLWRGTLNVQTFRATVEMTAALAIIANIITDELVEKMTWGMLKTLARNVLEANKLPHDDLDAYLKQCEL